MGYLCFLVSFSAYLPCVHLLASVLDYFLTSVAFVWKLPSDLVSVHAFLYGIALSASQWKVALNELKQMWCKNACEKKNEIVVES